jgi:hypothetical protein
MCILCTSCASVPEEVQEEIDYRNQLEKNSTLDSNINLEYDTIDNIKNSVNTILDKSYGVLSIKYIDDLSNVSSCDEINVTLKKQSIVEHKQEILEYFGDFTTTENDWVHYEETPTTLQEDGTLILGNAESYFYKKDNVEFGVDVDGGITFYNGETSYQGMYETQLVDDYDKAYLLSDGIECSFNDLKPYILQLLNNLSTTLGNTYDIRYCGVLYNQEDNNYHYIIDCVQTYNGIPFNTLVGKNSFMGYAQDNGIYQGYNYVTIEINKPNEVLQFAQSNQMLLSEVVSSNQEIISLDCAMKLLQNTLSEYNIISFDSVGLYYNTYTENLETDSTITEFTAIPTWYFDVQSAQGFSNTMIFLNDDSKKVERYSVNALTGEIILPSGEVIDDYVVQ